jgi:sarcosine oxidase, subunit gamma
VSEHDATDLDSTVPGHYGIAATGVTLSIATMAVAWNVQGDPARTAFVAGIAQRFGVPLPLVPNTTKRGNEVIAFWLGPRSWLLVESAPVPSALADFWAQRDALNAQGGALFDVSASRVAYRIRGPQAATVLAKGCPLDFHPDVFPIGSCAQSVSGHVNALFYRQDAAPTFVMLVARSLGRDAWRSLRRGSAQYGYDVAPPRAIGEVR